LSAADTHATSRSLVLRNLRCVRPYTDAASSTNDQSIATLSSHRMTLDPTRRPAIGHMPFLGISIRHSGASPIRMAGE
jgi:hypothetical protein